MAKPGGDSAARVNCRPRAVGVVAVTASPVWPTWFTDVSLAGWRNDALGHRAAADLARKATEKIGGLSPAWTEEAVRLALDNRSPRVNVLEVMRPVEIDGLQRLK
jgi:hypothetical protein